MKRIDDSLAVWPGRESGLGFKSWLGETARLARVSVMPPRFPPKADLPRGDGQGVLVIPGFLTGDTTTGRLRTFLWRSGYHAEGWQCGRNLGPRARVIERLRARVDHLAEKTGGPIAVMGVSLGGVFAREIARLVPDRIRAVATLCSPVQLPVPTPLAPFVWALQRWFDEGLVAGAAGEAQMPEQPMLALYSRGDGIVEWQACVPPRRPNITAIELGAAGHSTIGSNPDAQAHLARFLARVFQPAMDALPQR